jgi:hypothetical protein
MQRKHSQTWSICICTEEWPMMVIQMKKRTRFVMSYLYWFTSKTYRINFLYVCRISRHLSFNGSLTAWRHREHISIYQATSFIPHTTPAQYRSVIYRVQFKGADVWKCLELMPYALGIGGQWTVLQMLKPSLEKHADSETRHASITILFVLPK